MTSLTVLYNFILVFFTVFCGLNAFFNVCYFHIAICYQCAFLFHKMF